MIPSSKALRRALLSTFLLLPFTAALAQTPVPIPITGHVTAIAGTPVPDAFLKVLLQNCDGGTPRVTGYSAIVQTSYTFAADGTGLVNGTIWPNDQITCNLTTGATQYAVTLVSNDVPVGLTQCYQVTQAQGVWNITTQQPVACTATPANPQDATYRNLNVTGFFSGVNGMFTGTLTAEAFNWATTPTHCTLPAVSYGWDINFNVLCTTPAAAPVSSVFGRTGAVVAVSGDYNYGQISGTPTLYYQTVQRNFVSLTQRGVLDFTTNFAVTDSTSPFATKVDLSPSGVTPGTYASCTYDTYGRATACTAGAGGITDDFSWNTCTPATSTDSSCTGTVTLPHSGYADNSYIPVCMVNANNGAFYAVSISGALTSTGFPYTLTCTFNCGATVAGTLYCHSHHN